MITCSVALSEQRCEKVDCLIGELVKEMTMKQKALKELQTIPSVGPSIARDLWGLGIRKVADLKNKDPQRLYNRFCEKAGKPVDRCVLYTFRCAVYYASHKRHTPRLLKWWNWKD